MTDMSPTPEAPAPETPAPDPTEPVAATPVAEPAPPVEPTAAGPAATPARRRHVAVPVWLLTVLVALLGAAAMFGVGYVVGDRGDGRTDEAVRDFDAPTMPGRGPGGFGGGDLPGRGSDDSRQLPVPGGGSGSGQGQVPSTPSTSGAFLGVATQQVSGGVEITQVASGSAAERAGLEVGDVITDFNGRSVTTPTALGTAVANLQPGDRVSIEIQRDGSSRELTVTLGSRSTTNSN